MKLVIAKSAGFCFGVKRAINKAFEVAKADRNVFTLGPIIHNPQVIEALAAQGVGVARDITELKQANAKKVIIRTHGISLEDMSMLKQEGFDVMDLTCPYVKKAQHYAKLLKKEGYQVVILGDIEHPEVIGLKSYAGKAAWVVKDAEGLPKEIKSKVGLIVQTTQPIEALKRLISKVVEQTRQMKVYNTICSSTAQKLKETEEVAKGADVMLVVGGRNSANTTQLARLCEHLSVPTHHIETAGELQERWFRGARKIGLTAGASTPDWIIEGVIKVLKDMGGCNDNGNQR
ncbi:MAG: 4-hydroxy-3-methylbut-2-enyl diphosphate reductase [Nitrospiraceae bacterium]|nr:4-hydroxy-3-methylbut-2-enyl diphosphate reductase [Nitrospiraceae bacterium]MDA8327182.1 4-hydroxy-3-methylbut-2-enyl diphosphate reductase [Nitrospiraceae bacterium]